MFKSDIIRNIINEKIKKGEINIYLKKGKLTEKMSQEISLSLNTTYSYVKDVCCDYIKHLKTGRRLMINEKIYKHNHREYTNYQRLRNYSIGRKHDYNRCIKYTKEEEEMILGRYDGTDRKLGKLIKRSVQAIQGKRTKLNKEK